MQLNKDEIRVIAEILKSKDGLHVYTIFRRSGIAVEAVAKALNTLVKQKILLDEGNTYRLTERGLKISAQFPRIGSPTSSTRSTATAPDRSIAATKRSRVDDVAGPTVGINHFYVPKTSELPKSMRKLLVLDEFIG